MLGAFVNAFRTPDLRRKLLFVLFVIALFRLGSAIPSPGVDYHNVQECVSSVKGQGIYGLINLFSGGALLKLTIFALGIMPYITASIILQLLTVVIPRLETLKKEGQAGTAKITQYTRYLTLGLAILQSTGIVALARTGQIFQNSCDLPLLVNQNVSTMVLMVVTLTAGTAMIMWLGELITERGIGNGMSILIFTSIVSTFPTALWGIKKEHGWDIFVIVVAIGLVIMAAVVFIEQAQRRIPVQYAKRVVGRKVYGGSNTYLPLRVNTAGVIPVIFASSILVIPQTIAQMIKAPWAKAIGEQLSVGEPLYYLLQVLGIIFFGYFYTSIVFNPVDTADNMRKYGGFIPGIRPGKRTAEYIDRVLTRITFVGSIYLAAVCILPEFLIAGVHVAQLPFGVGAALDRALPVWFTEGMGYQFYFGGTSLLIVVGVAMDTINQIESQLVMRHYDGFMKRGRIRGRRG